VASQLDRLVWPLLDSEVAAVEVQSTWAPPIWIPDPFSASARGDDGETGTVAAPGGTFDLARFMRPKVIVHMRNGSTKSFTPYGDPGDSNWPWLVLGLGLAFGGAVAYAYNHGKRRR
jgi:hypothetical protein